MSTGGRFSLYVILDQKILELHLTSHSSRGNAVNRLLDHDYEAEIWTRDNYDFWFFDSLNERKSFISIEDLPNWLKLYLLIGA